MLKSSFMFLVPTNKAEDKQVKREAKQEIPMESKKDELEPDSLKSSQVQTKDEFSKTFEKYQMSLIESSKIISSDFHSKDPILLMKTLKEQNEANSRLIEMLKSGKATKTINLKNLVNMVGLNSFQNRTNFESLLKSDMSFQKEETNMDYLKNELYGNFNEALFTLNSINSISVNDNRLNSTDQIGPFSNNRIEIGHNQKATEAQKSHLNPGATIWYEFRCSLVIETYFKVKSCLALHLNVRLQFIILAIGNIYF